MTDAELHQLKRWNTPTIYNGWEQITRRDACADAFNLEETRDFMPQMGPMAGYAVTVVIEPSNAAHRQTNPQAWSEYRRYVASVSGPKVVVVQDLDSNIHRALGCVGTIVDGAIRDLDEMTDAGFKALARRLCVGHAAVHPVRWGCEVEVFGRRVAPGDLIHADKHGFLVVPAAEEPGLLEAARFMDANECETVIPAARGTVGLDTEAILARIDAAGAEFGRRAKAKFGGQGEW